MKRMDEITEMYKVVRRWQGKLLSLIHGEAALEYPVGEWVSAHEKFARRGYHPLGFCNLRSAWIYAQPKGEVWRCEVKGFIKALPPRCCEDELVRFGHLAILEWQVSHWPHGTVMAEQVKLVEQVMEYAP